MQSVHVLFGTESGNTQGLAKRAADALTKAGLSPVVVDMMDFDPPKLVELQMLFVITSTYGNGDPPSNAEQLHAYLMKKCGPLPALAFSVCALGDTTYDRFAQCGKDFDKRLGELGAARIAPRQDCDVDYDDAFEAWLKTAVAAVHERTAQPPVSAGDAAAAVVVPASEPSRRGEPKGTRRNPVIARVTKNVNLNGSGSTKETRHIELTFEEPMPYELGDSIGVWPTNEPALVRELLDMSGLSGEETVRFGPEELPLEQALSTKLDIVQPDVRLLEHAFGALSSDRRRELLAERHVIDVLADIAPRLGAVDLVSLLRPLAPRQYSIASSPLVHPGEVHLTVAVVRYERGGRKRGGVASIQLADRAPEGARLRLYLHPSPGFRLAPRDRDIIMIGPGTGVAPFRAYLEERSRDPGAPGAKRGRSWLFFGARHRKTDFLYEDDFATLQRDGVLTELDLAFSRDEAHKIYVQTRMLERKRELYAWLEGGAILYVCGDASHMAPDVHATLVSILVSEGALTEAAARTRLDEWLANGRYRKDVY